MEVPKTFRKAIFAYILSNMIYFQNLKLKQVPQKVPTGSQILTLLYLENKKSFLDEIKSFFFFNFVRAIIW